MSATMKSDDTRSPDEIERDLQRTRAELSGTLEAIQSKLTPGQMMDQALQYARSSLPADFGRNLNEAVRNNPVPVALVGIGLAWMMISGRQGSVAHGGLGSTLSGSTLSGGTRGAGGGRSMSLGGESIKNQT